MPDDSDMYLVRSLDGEPKEWMWNSRMYSVPGNRGKVLPAGPAFQAVAFYTRRDQVGEVTCSVEIEEHAGTVGEDEPAAPSFVDPDTGIAYKTSKDLVAAVTKRILEDTKKSPSVPVGSPALPGEAAIGTIPCGDCDETFASPGALRAHRKEAHPPQN